MRGVRLGGICLKPALVVKINHELGIARQGFGRADICNPMPFPQTACIAESQQPAVGADSRAGQDNAFFHCSDSLCRLKPILPNGSIVRMEPRGCTLFGGGFLVFQFRSQTKAFFIFRLRRIVILHTECAGVDPKREKRNDKGAKTYDVPKHLFSCIFDVQQ